MSWKILFKVSATATAKVVKTNVLAYYEARKREGKEPEGTRISTTLGTNPTFTTLRDATNQSGQSIALPVNQWVWVYQTKVMYVLVKWLEHLLMI